MHRSTSGWQETATRQASRQTDSLAALAVTLFLVVTGLYLTEVLRAQASFQDCVMSGKSDCQSTAR